MRVYRLLRIGKLKQRMVPYKRTLHENSLSVDRRVIALSEHGLDNPTAEPVIITDDHLVLFANGQIWHLGGRASLESHQVPEGHSQAFAWQPTNWRSMLCYMIWR